MAASPKNNATPENARCSSRLGRAALLALAIAAPYAHALTGNDLHGLMQGDRDAERKLAAVMYVAGLTDGIAFGQYVAQENKVVLRGPAICLPREAQVSQAYDVIKEYLATSPAKRHMDAGVLSALALQRVWPCK